MSRIVPSSILTALSQPEVQPFYAVEFSFDSGTLRFWSGYGDRVIQGQTYTGTGSLLSISGMEEAADMSAKSSTVSMSGIPGELVSLALQESYQNRPCRILFGVVNSTDIVESFAGFMDKMSIEDSGDTATITMSIESKWVKLDRLIARRYTSESQKSRYATDTFFDFVADLQDKEVVWGRASA